MGSYKILRKTVSVSYSNISTTVFVKHCELYIQGRSTLNGKDVGVFKF